MYNDQVQIMNMGKISAIPPMKCTMVRLTCKATGSSYQNYKLKLPRDPATSFLKICPKEIFVHSQIYMQIYTHRFTTDLSLY